MRFALKQRNGQQLTNHLRALTSLTFTSVTLAYVTRRHRPFLQIIFHCSSPFQLLIALLLR